MRDPARIPRMVSEMQTRVPDNGICGLMDSMALFFYLEDEETEKRIMGRKVTQGERTAPFAQLEKTWQSVPDWRLAQLWENAEIGSGATDEEVIQKLESIRVRFGEKEVQF